MTGTEANEMTVNFWGVRGSIPVPGPTTSRYGGNTPCLSIPLDERHTLVLDAGTGLRYVPVSPDTEGHTYFFLISHPHWDHIQGFPFFTPRNDPAASIIFLHEDQGSMASHVLGQLDGIHFPLDQEEIESTITRSVSDRNALLAPFGITIQDFDLCHPGGANGFLLESESGSLLYMSDNELGQGFDRASIPRARNGFDILIHDAQYVSTELETHRGWGHSSMPAALDLAADLGCSSLVLFHHDPFRTDEDLALLEKELQLKAPADLKVLAACEGMSLEW